MDGGRPAPSNGRSGTVASSRVTIDDVAALARVSRATVSRVLNASDHVTQQTRQRVLAAAAELGFMSNPAARALAGGRGDRVGILVLMHPWSPADDRFLGTVSAAAAESAAASNLGVFLRRLPVGDQGRMGTVAADPHLAGLLVVNPTRAALAALPESALKRTVTFGACAPDVAAVDVDSVSATRAALDHLTGLGRRSIMAMVGPHDLACVRQRASAYRSYLADRGLPSRVVSSLYSTEAAARAFAAAIAAAGPPDAVFAAGDGFAAGVLDACRQLGRPAADDVAVVGFDDDPRQGSSRHRAVHSPVPGIAAAAMAMIASGPDPGARVLLPPGPLGEAESR